MSDHFLAETDMFPSSAETNFYSFYSIVFTQQATCLYSTIWNIIYITITLQIVFTDHYQLSYALRNFLMSSVCTRTGNDTHWTYKSVCIGNLITCSNVITVISNRCLYNYSIIVIKLTAIKTNWYNLILNRKRNHIRIILP